jgi:hypothetical protein
VYICRDTGKLFDTPQFANGLESFTMFSLSITLANDCPYEGISGETKLEKGTKQTKNKYN